MKAVFAVVAGLLAAVATVEIGLKLVSATPLWRVLPVVEPILGRPERDTGYSFVPGASGIWPHENRAPVRINSFGLRDVETAREKPPGRLRVALIGDSVVEALQVDASATFDALLEKELRSVGFPVEVLNLGMSGHGPLRQLVRLERVGIDLRPDMVVAVPAAIDFLTGELLRDRDHPGYVPDGSGGLVRGYAFREQPPVRRAETRLGVFGLEAIRNSEVLRMAYLRSREPVKAALGLAPAADTGAAAAARAAQRDPCQSAQLTRFARLWRDREPARDWQATSKVLDEVAATAREHGFPVLYAVRAIPVPGPGCATEAALRQELTTSIERELTARGIAFLDVQSALAAIAGDTRHLLGFGTRRGFGHLNHEGHRLYAQVLRDAVAKRLRAPR